MLYILYTLTLHTMSYNNEFILRHLANDPHAPASPEASSSRSHAPRHALLPRGPTLAHALPSSHVLEEEAVRSSSLELARQSVEAERERALAEALAEEERKEKRRELKESQGTWTNLIAGRRKGKGKGGVPDTRDGKTKPFDRPPQAYELYAAIDKKDLK